MGDVTLPPNIVGYAPDKPVGSDIPIVRDYPVPPPIVSVILPNPRILVATSAKPVSNQVPITAAKPGDPEPYVFGRCICDPILLTASDALEDLYIDVLWSVGECAYIEYLILENTNEGRGDALGHIQHFEGATGQATSSLMEAAFGGDYDALDGKCHSVLRRRSASDSLNFKAMIRGLKLYDPRNSPAVPVYSTNPALALARILTDCGYTMDWDSVGDVADYCDDYLGSPRQKRWEIGIQIKDRQELRNWVQTFATYANCFVELQGSNAFLIADKPRASNHTILAADMIKDTVTISRAGGRNVPERVTVSYMPITETGNPENHNPSIPGVDWVSIVETRTASTDTSADSGTTSVLPLPGIQTYSRARRMATQVYNRSRNDMTLEFQRFDDGIKRTIGDVGTITNALFGLSATTMTLIEHRPIDRGRWYSKYIDYDASNYSDALYTEPPWNQVILLNPNSPPVGPTPTLTQEMSGDDVVIKIEFTGVEWAYTKDYHVVAVAHDEVATVVLDTYISYGGATTHTTYTNPVVYDETYTVYVYVRSNTLAVGSPGSADITITQADILWSVDPLTVSNLDDGADSIFSPQAAASITFWDYHYEFPDCTAATYQINCATFGSERLISHDFLAGEYLVKYTIIPTESPAPVPPTVYVDNVAGIADTWYDLFQTEIRIQDSIDDETQNTVVLDITVAKSDMASPQAPVAGTEKTKRVTFVSDYGNEPYIYEPFLYSNGTDVDTTTFFTTMFGDPEIQSNRVKGGSTGSPAHSSGDHAATTNDSWSLFSDAKCQLIFNVGSTGVGTFGILGRQADAPNAGNCWQLVLTDADTEDPVLSLQQMSGSGATMDVVVTRANVTLTGEGPFNYGVSGYFSVTMELEMVGTSIVGRMWTPMIGVPYSVSYTSSTYQDQSRWGFRLSGTNDGWVDDFKIYPLEPYPVFAKHLGDGSSPVNYYKLGNVASGGSPNGKIWTGGLLPATSSGDTYQQLTLVFCVYPVQHDDDKVFIFGSGQSAFTVGTYDHEGGLWLSARDPSTGLAKNVFITPSGSPSDAGGLTAGEWHAVMIAVDYTGSPQDMNVDVWIDGVEVYSGVWNDTYNQFAPMDWTGPCYVGAGDKISGSAPGHDPDFWEGLNCYLSYVWAKETYLDPATYWGKFFDENNQPRWIGTEGENITGTAANTFCPDGDFTNNLGSGPNWTEVGTVPDAPSSPSD